MHQKKYEYKIKCLCKIKEFYYVNECIAVNTYTGVYVPIYSFQGLVSGMGCERVFP